MEIESQRGMRPSLIMPPPIRSGEIDPAPAAAVKTLDEELRRLRRSAGNLHVELRPPVLFVAGGEVAERLRGLGLITVPWRGDLRRLVIIASTVDFNCAVLVAIAEPACCEIICALKRYAQQILSISVDGCRTRRQVLAKVGELRGRKGKLR